LPSKGCGKEGLAAKLIVTVIGELQSTGWMTSAGNCAANPNKSGHH
jgi:hypothetical protein